MTINNTLNAAAADANQASDRVDTVVNTDGAAVVIANTAVETAPVADAPAETVVQETAMNVENTTEVVADTAADTTVETVVETPAPAADAPKTEGKKHKGKKHGGRDKRDPRAPRTTALVKGDAFDTGVVMDWFSHDNGVLVAVIKDGKEERGLLMAAGVKLDSVRGTDKDQRDALSKSRLAAIKSGAEPVPALTVTEITSQGARFTETARLNDIRKNAEFKAKREQKATDIEVVRGMAGETIENAPVVGFALYRDGARKDEPFGVFVGIRGDVDGMIHGSKLKGGFARLKTLKVGDTLPSITLVEVKDVERHGRQDIQVSVSELATFPLSAGQTMRGASFVKRNGDDMVFNWNGFDVYLADADRTVNETSLTKERGQKTNLTYKGTDGFGRVRAEKKGK